MSVTLCCSLYACKGDRLRVDNTLKWYKSLCRSAGSPFTLVLINDQSEEPFEPILRAIKPWGFCKNVQYFKSADRVGKAVQLNRAFINIRTTYTGMIDNDVILPHNWLRDCIRVLQEPGMATCGVLVEDWIQIGPIYSVYYENQDCVNFTYPDQIGGACIIWDRNKLKGEGFLWEGAGVYGHEDAEFNQRIGRRVGRIASLVARGYSVSDHTFPEWEQWKRAKATQSHGEYALRLQYLEDEYKKKKGE